jgi:polyhydroxyalkanoate synthesis regulator phasin
MSLFNWENKFGWPQLIQIGLIGAAIVGFGFKFYYDTEAERLKQGELKRTVDQLTTTAQQLEGQVNTVSDALMLVPSQITVALESVKTDLNLLRIEVVKTTGEVQGLRRDVDRLEDGGAR